MNRALPVNIEVGSEWKRRNGQEVLVVRRHWLASNPTEWCVRGHPKNGGKPLICPDTYLIENYDPIEAAA